MLKKHLAYFISSWFSMSWGVGCSDLMQKAAHEILVKSLKTPLNL